MRFDWTDLRVFLHACEAGSMTAAADRSNLTLAAVSARIRALEDSAGVQLMVRHARGVAPTPAGQALARHARLVFHQLDALRRDVAQPASPNRTETVVLANSSAMARPLARVLGDTLERHPGAGLRLRESSSEVTVHALHSGAADVGLVADSVDTQGLVVARLGPDPLVLVAASKHPLARRERIAFAQALPHAWIGWGEAGALHTHLVMRANQAGAALSVAASVPSTEGVLELVARGLGVTVLPRALLPRPAPGLAVLALADAWAQRQLLVCRRPDCADPVALDLFGGFESSLSL
jgi:DNA-binding transcriptional LysR family regulator